MTRKKNYEIRSKFHNFWSSREFIMNLQAYEYFSKWFTKFSWIRNPNSDSSPEFKTWHNLSNFQVWLELNRFKPKMKFELNSIWNLNGKEKRELFPTGSKQPAAHSARQDEAQLHGLGWRPLVDHADWLWPERAHHALARSHRVWAWHLVHLPSAKRWKTLEPAAEKWSKGLKTCAAMPGPTQDGREGGPHRGSGHGGRNLTTRWRRTTCSGPRG
jgi:hypothetical protein